MENSAQAAATMGSRMDPATLAHTPALEPPKGVTPNFVDPYSLQPLMIGIVVLCQVLTAIAIGIRVYTRVRTVKGHWEECKWIHHSLYYMICDLIRFPRSCYLSLGKLPYDVDDSRRLFGS